MCGIVGFIDPEGRTPDPERVLERMCAALRHRGPDDAGRVVAAPAWLGHRRLSVVDPTPAGRQPFSTDAGVHALANAEIYNHQTLRRRLSATIGDREIPRSDCAVLPWAWQAWGDRLAEQLRGMYAVAVWDEQRHQLYLARDAAGQKPLYYAFLPGGGLAFASEPKALLVHPLIGRDVDHLALRRYLLYDFVPGERTIYRRIRKLEPGTSLTWRPGQPLRRRRHFDIPDDPVCTLDADAAAERLWEHIGDAVETRLMSDVPLGVLLSGGLDSTALVAALAERVDPASIRTFSLGFDDRAFDERAHARVVAEHFGTTHRELRLSATDVMDAIPEILAHVDEPFADASLVPTWLLSRFTRRHVTVALGGDGGDELFWGYPTFLAHRLAAVGSRVPRALRRAVLEHVIPRIPASHGYMPLEFKARRFLEALDLRPDRRHPVWVGGVPPWEHAVALGPAARDAVRPDAGEHIFAPLDRIGARFDAARPGGDPIERVAWQYFGTYLAEGVLAKVDRASMAHSLEVRAPLLDPRVMRFAATLPPAFKLRGRTTKWLMRHMLAFRVPGPIAARPKRGFALPMGAWLAGPLQPWVRSVLDSRRIEAGGLLNARWTEQIMAEHFGGVRSHHKALWTAIVLETWRTSEHGPDPAR